MFIDKFQKFFEDLSADEREQEVFMMFGIIFSLLFFAIIGISTVQTLAMVF